jgi:hypothetical protein
MQRHKVNWVNEALLIQETFHFEVFHVLYSHVVKLDLIEVPFSIIKLVNIFFNINLRQFMHQKES